MEANATDIISGGISGTCVDIIPLTFIIHKGGLLGEIHGKCLGRATILGRTGTYIKAISVTFSVGHGNIPYGVVGHGTLGDGTGGLAGIHGQESDFSPDGNGFTYTAQIHFDP